MENLKKNRFPRYESVMQVNIAGKQSSSVIEYQVSVPLKQVGTEYQLIFVIEVQDICRDIYDILNSADEFCIYRNKEQMTYFSENQYTGKEIGNKCK